MACVAPLHFACTLFPPLQVWTSVYGNSSNFIFVWDINNPPPVTFNTTSEWAQGAGSWMCTFRPQPSGLLAVAILTGLHLFPFVVQWSRATSKASRRRIKQQCASHVHRHTVACCASLAAVRKSTLPLLQWVHNSQGLPPA